MTRATVVYQQIVYGNVANQIHGLTIEYGKFILKCFISISTVVFIFQLWKASNYFYTKAIWKQTKCSITSLELL